ncbi:MAG: tetratricopeptide repeat protein [Vicinamibacterales bacterium]
MQPHAVSILTVTLGRRSLEDACASVDGQTFAGWHHYVIGDGVRPPDFPHPQRTTFGFTRAIGAEEPGRNMPDGSPNPLLRWAIAHLRLGELVCCLDDDNTYDPRFIETLHRALVDSPSAGIALCAAEDLRYNRHEMDGYPEYGRCDNSAFLVRTPVAKAVGFPFGGRAKEVVQDYEFIRACATRAGWTRVPDVLVHFGRHPNPPPRRGGTKIVYSWSLPIRGARLVEEGRLDEGMALLREAIAFDPNDAWARWHLGEALLLCGRAGEAAEVWAEWDRLVDAAGPTPHDWIDYCRGLVCLIHGNPARGAHFLERAVTRASERCRSSPADAEDVLNLCVYTAAANRPGDGDVWLAHALALDPPDRLRRDTARQLALLARVVPHVPAHWMGQLAGGRGA